MNKKTFKLVSTHLICVLFLCNQQQHGEECPREEEQQRRRAPQKDAAFTAASE
jgi:hypothetical protein